MSVNSIRRRRGQSHVADAAPQHRIRHSGGGDTAAMSYLAFDADQPRWEVQMECSFKVVGCASVVGGAAGLPTNVGTNTSGAGGPVSDRGVRSDRVVVPSWVRSSTKS